MITGAFFVVDFFAVVFLRVLVFLLAVDFLVVPQDFDANFDPALDFTFELLDLRNLEPAVRQVVLTPFLGL